MNKPILLLQNIKLPFTEPLEAALAIAEKKLLKAGVTPLSLTLAKRSVDARKKEEILFVCSVAAEVERLPEEKVLTALSAVALEKSHYEPILGDEPMAYPPVVVGFGPAGMFSALAFAEKGFRPVVLERGGSIKEREKAVETFYRTRVLSKESNIQFGAGGAGTFSDGKLVTRKNDPLCAYVLERLVEFGAPKEILVNAKPHIGTDLLKKVVEKVASRIEELGGKWCPDLYYGYSILRKYIEVMAKY